MRRALENAAIIGIAFAVFSCSGDGSPGPDPGPGPITIDPPTNVSATLISATSARVTWTASTSDKVTSYNVIRNGTKLTEVSGTSYTDNELTELTQYAYAVSANGPSGVVSSVTPTSTSTTVTPPDVTPPTVTAFSPGAGATGIASTAVIDATFSEAIDQSTLNVANFSVKTSGGATIAGAITYAAGTRVAEFRPTANFPNAGGVSVSISGVKDVAGNAMASAYNSSFTVRDETPPDITPPTVTGVSPSSGATGVALNVAPTITFSRAMNAASITTSTITLTPSGGAAIAAGVAYNSTTNVATITPSSPLLNSTTYTITATTGVQGSNNVPLAAAFTSTFTTAAAADVTPPTVTAVTPTNASVNVSIGTSVVVTFSEAMNAGTVTTSTFTLTPSGGSAIAANVSYNSGNNTATLTPSSALSSSTTYTVNVTSGAKDIAGNGAAPFSSTFTTAAPVDNTPPIVISSLPANGATNVAIDAPLAVTFSEAMDPSTLTTSTMTLKVTSSSTNVAGIVAYNAGTNTATFYPTSPLAYSTGYTLTISTGAKDVGGNGLALPATVSITTVPQPVVTPPIVSSTNPPNGATGVGIRSPISVTFSKDIDPATINTSTFIVPAVCGRVSYDAGTRTATFNPVTSDTNGTRDTVLANGFDYTARISAGVKDLAGNALASDTTFGFKTETAGSGPFTLNGAIYSGTTCNSHIHVHLAFVQSGSTLTYSGACPLANECYMYPLVPAAADEVGPNSPGLVYPKVASGSGTINGSELIFNFTLENGRTFTLKATVTANNRMSGIVYGPTLSPIAVEIRN